MKKDVFKIKISVVMPVYNGEKYLKEAIDSILNQTFTDFEFIIIDDGSTDKTASIIQTYEDNRIRYIKNKKNSGVSFSANRGFEEAKGTYIARMDADDISLPNRLQKQFTFMEENESFVACCGNVIYMSEDEKHKSKPWAKNAFVPTEWLLCVSNPIPQPTIFIRKCIIDKYALKYDTDIRLAEDYDLWTKITNIGQIYRMSEVLLYYRELNTSAFHLNMEKTYQNATISNQKLIKTVTGSQSPYFHTYLTSFCLKEDRPKEFVEIKKIITWLNELSTILAHKWNWDNKTKKIVQKDYARILANYATRLPKKVIIKNIFSFLPIGIGFYFQFTKKLFNYIKAKFKRLHNER